MSSERVAFGRPLTSSLKHQHNQNKTENVFNTVFCFLALICHDFKKTLHNFTYPCVAPSCPLQTLFHFSPNVLTVVLQIINATCFVLKKKWKVKDKTAEQIWKRMWTEQTIIQIWSRGGKQDLRGAGRCRSMLSLMTIFTNRCKTFNLSMSPLTPNLSTPQLSD